MRISKKLAGSIVIGAIGCLTLFSKEVIAEEVNCKGFHLYNTIGEEYSETSKVHSYLCGTIEQEDGIEEYVYQDCIITTTIDTYERKCEKCGKTFPQQGVGEKKAHSHASFLTESEEE